MCCVFRVGDVEDLAQRGNLYDGFDFPFYMRTQDKVVKGYTAFSDSPGIYKNAKQDNEFNATLILYEKTGKELIPVLVLNWGYKVSNGKTTVKPLTVTKIPENDKK